LSPRNCVTDPVQTMSDARRRGSRLDHFSEFPPTSGVTEEQNRKNIIAFDNLLYENWNLGANIVLVWTICTGVRGIDILMRRHSEIVEFVNSSIDPLERDERNTYMESLLAVDKHVDRDDFEHIAEHLDLTPTHMPLPFSPGKGLNPRLMSSIRHQPRR
jgi:hypothetical protein